MNYNIVLSSEQIDILRMLYAGIRNNNIDSNDIYWFGEVLIDIQSQALDVLNDKLNEYNDKDTSDN